VDDNDDDGVGAPWEHLVKRVSGLDERCIEEPYAAEQALKAAIGDTEHLGQRLDTSQRSEMFAALGEAVGGYDPKQAASWFGQAVGAAASEEQRRSAGNQHANVLRCLGETDKAAALHSALLEELTATGADREALIVRRNLARDLYWSDRYADALPHLHIVRAGFDEMALDTELLETHLDLLSCAEGLKDWALQRCVLDSAHKLMAAANYTPDWLQAFILHQQAVLVRSTASDDDISVLLGLAATEAANSNIEDLPIQDRAFLRLELAELLTLAARHPRTVAGASLGYRETIVELAGTARRWYAARGDTASCARCNDAVAYGLGIRGRP